MPLTGLDHFSLRLTPGAMKAAVDFYCEVLGLEDGDRPPFPFPGRWLFCAGRAVVHLIGLGEEDAPAATGRIDHVAFQATDAASVRQRLAKAGVPFDERFVPETRAIQIFVRDPNGVTVELVFDEAAAPGGRVFGEDARL